MYIYIPHMVLLLVIIVVCAVIPRWGARVEGYADTSPKCKDAVLDMLTMGGKRSRSSAETELAPYMKVSAPEYLARMGVSFNTLPKELKDMLPTLDLSEVLLQMQKQGVIDVTGNDIHLNKCILPVSLLRRFEIMSPEYVDIADSTQYENTIYKHCYVGDLDLTSNIKNSYVNGGFPSDISRVVDADPARDNQTVYGCMVDYRNLQGLRDQLMEMYLYSDLDTMKRIKDLLLEFNVTYEVRENARSRKNVQEGKRDSMIARMEVEKRKVPPAQTNLTAQVTATNNAFKEMQNAMDSMLTAQRVAVANATNGGFTMS